MSPPAICCGTTPSFCSTRPGNPPMRILRPLRSSTVLISLRNQPPIWQPVLPASSAVTVVLLVEFVQHFLAAAQRLPALVQPLVRTERDRGAEGEGRVLAEIVIRGGVAEFDGAVLHRIDNLQARHDFAGGEGLNLELVVGRFGDRLAISSAPPNSVSSDFGQLAVMRHLSSGIDCAIAGAATALAAMPRPAVLMN